MAETMIEANGLHLAVERHGPEDGEPLLLVMGLGATLALWPLGFVEGLVDRGFHVIRYDNRDVGRSTKIGGDVDVLHLLGRIADDEPIEVPYLLSHMAEDAAHLLDALGIDQAHVVGASMGGMIVQTMAIEQAHKVKSVVSIMSTTGDPDVGQPTDEAMGALLAPPAATVEEAVEGALAAAKIWGSIEELRDDSHTEELTRAQWARGRDDMGVARQLAAILASGSRDEGLAEVTVPFTVIHGTVDNLVTPSGGRRTAEVVPHAELVEIEGMGHDMPVPVWPQIIEAITATARRANT